MKKSMLIDNSLCMGCRGCQTACKQWNQLPADDTTFTGTYENPLTFSGSTFTRVAFREYEVENEEGVPENQWVFTKLSCLHCTDAACVRACPAGAISHTDYGAVVIDDKKCIGCNYCISKCTFNVMGFDRFKNVARKCTFCDDRVAVGDIPACVKTCPAGAIAYGTRDEMTVQAQERVAKLRNNGHPQAELYGIDEVDGTGVLYILKHGRENAEERYGLPEEPRVDSMVYVWDYLFKPVRAVLVVALAFALWINRSESKKKEPEK